MDRSLARNNVYKMLSFLFRYPEESTRSLIMDGLWKKGLGESLKMLDEQYFAGCFEDFMNGCSADKMASQQEMVEEYERLFGDSLAGINDALSHISDVWHAIPDKERVPWGFSSAYGSGFKETERQKSSVICNKAEPLMFITRRACPARIATRRGSFMEKADPIRQKGMSREGRPA